MGVKVIDQATVKGVPKMRVKFSWLDYPLCSVAGCSFGGWFWLNKDGWIDSNGHLAPEAYQMEMMRAREVFELENVEP